MGLLITMLPVYLLGNLHCIGMCGPLVMLIGRHRYRYWYFVGRTLSFTLAATLSGLAGGVLHSTMVYLQIPALTSFLFGGMVLLMGGSILTGAAVPGQQWLAGRLAGTSSRLSLLLLQEGRLPTFLFGLCTVALPCGQSLLVFSTCALSADVATAALNGFAFAVLTSPSLFLAMGAHGLLASAKRYYNGVVGVLALVVGGLAIARGFAEIGVIDHLVLNQQGAHYFQVVIF